MKDVKKIRLTDSPSSKEVKKIKLESLKKEEYDLDFEKNYCEKKRLYDSYNAIKNDLYKPGE